MDIITLNQKIADAMEAEGIWLDEALRLAEAGRRMEVYKIYEVLLFGDEKLGGEGVLQMSNYLLSKWPNKWGAQPHAQKEDTELHRKFKVPANYLPIWHIGAGVPLNGLEVQTLYAKQTGRIISPKESPTPTLDLTLNQIRTDGGTQARAGLNEDTVAEYLQAMKELAVFPPLIIFYDGQDYWLADGFHRLEALKRWGVHRPGRHLLDIRQGTQRDAVLFACGANATHGLKRSNEDKRRAVARLLQDEEWATWADREIARRCNVSAPFVGQMRAELGVVMEERTYTTKHGTVATMTTPQKPTALVEPPDGYVLCDDIGLYSLCPTCGHKGKSEPNRPVRFSGYEFCQEIQCLNCGHEFLKLTIGGVLRCYHLPNSGKKPEVEIGGQELQNVGGQEEFQPPAGYVLITKGIRGTHLHDCPNCGQQFKGSHEPHPDNGCNNLVGKWDITCIICKAQVLMVITSKYKNLYFYLEGSGEKLEVEIGGHVGGQEEFQPPFKWVLIGQLTTWGTCVTCGTQKSDEWKSRNIYLPNSHICREMLCPNCGHKYLVVQLHINDEPHLVPCYHLPNSGAVVEVPAEYKNWPRIKRIIEFENGDKCPNCGKYGKKVEQHLALEGYDYSWISTCVTCFHHQLIFGVNNGHRFRFHTPPLKSGKPEVEIGGQEVTEIGGQDFLDRELANYASEIAKEYDPDGRAFHALLYLEKLMRCDATSEVDPEGVLLDEIINEVYSGENLLDVLLSLMGEPA